MGDFKFTPDEYKAGLKPALMELVTPGSDSSLSQQTAALVESGRPEAFYAPAVRVVLDAALNTVTQPSVTARLPREVEIRRNIAIHCATYAVNLAQYSNLFPQYYRNNQELMAVASDNPSIDDLEDNEYLTSIGEAPFFDAAIACGGALRILQANDNKVNEEPAAVIARSTGLLAISGIYKGNSPKAVEFLGAPYADPQHMEVRDGEEGIKVHFTDTATTHLRSLSQPNRGCPAAKLDAENAHVSLLEQYWKRMAHYLVPPDASVDAIK